VLPERWGGAAHDMVRPPASELQRPLEPLTSLLKWRLVRSGLCVEGSVASKCSALALRPCPPSVSCAVGRLMGLKNIFWRQLPNMPKEYIVRLVLGPVSTLLPFSLPPTQALLPWCTATLQSCVSCGSELLP